MPCPSLRGPLMLNLVEKVHFPLLLRIYVLQGEQKKSDKGGGALCVCVRGSVLQPHSCQVSHSP